MPYYEFINENTGEVIELFFHMNDKKFYIDKDGYEWVRQLSVPNASVDTKIDCNSSHDFIDKTKNKKGTIGDLWDRSKELSDKRNSKYGKDKILEKHYEKYAKERNGKDHPEVRKRKLKETLKNNPLFKLS